MHLLQSADCLVICIHSKTLETMALSVQCALGWIPTGTLVIVWRGTANFRNVITDIKFFSRKVRMLDIPGQRATFRHALPEMAMMCLTTIHIYIYICQLYMLHRQFACQSALALLEACINKSLTEATARQNSMACMINKYS